MTDSAIREPKRLELAGGHWVDVERCVDVPDDLDRGIKTWLRLTAHSDGLGPAELAAALEAHLREWSGEVMRRLFDRPPVVLPVVRGGEA